MPREKKARRLFLRTCLDQGSRDTWYLREVVFCLRRKGEGSTKKRGWGLWPQTLCGSRFCLTLAPFGALWWSESLDLDLLKPGKQCFLQPNLILKGTFLWCLTKEWKTSQLKPWHPFLLFRMYLFILFYFIFLAAPHGLWDLSYQPGIEPGAKQWKHRVLTIGPPGNSLRIYL